MNLKDYKYPYLLKGLTIERPNQVWEADITYIPMFRGFMYKFAIIDVYSRKIMAWGVSNSMTVEWCKEIVLEAIDKKGKMFQIRCDGLLARIIQHEYDHLNGVEFTEKVYDYSKLMNYEHYKKYIKKYPLQISNSKITIKEIKYL